MQPTDEQIILMDNMLLLIAEKPNYPNELQSYEDALGLSANATNYIHNLICEYGQKIGFLVEQEFTRDRTIVCIDEKKLPQFINEGGFKCYFDNLRANNNLKASPRKRLEKIIEVASWIAGIIAVLITIWQLFIKNN